MSRSKGTANLAASLEVLAGAPLDAREKVPTKADLYIAANFPYPYVGLETYVVAENKKYRLVGNDVTVEANWQEVGSGGSGGTTVVANPEGEATDELEKLQVGNDIYSIPEENVEINKAQFDALPAATKNNGKAYFIPDANLVSNFTVMGNRFDKANIYDTTERMVGRWIDGKPLYQRTIVCGALPNNGISNVVHNISNIDSIVGYDGISIKPSDGTVRFIPTPTGSDNAKLIGVSVNKTQISIWSPDDWSAYTNTYVTLRYTKTTDASVAIGTENDYSTDEMIIGTWIDGKPIYQKTVHISNMNITVQNSGEASTELTDLASLNINSVVNLIVGSCNWGGTGRVQLPVCLINNSVSISVDYTYNYDTKKLSIRHFRSSSSTVISDFYVTIQYTKTTD